MTLLWKTPRQWETNDAITKEKLNEISDELTYLMLPSYGLATVRAGAANQTTASTTPVDLDIANYQLRVELTGVRPVLIELEGAFANNTLAAVSRFDVMIDGTTYVSSLSGTNLANGAMMATQYVAAYVIPLKLRILLPPGTLAAGVHTFVPKWWVSAGTTTWFQVNVLSQFYVGEF